MSLPRGFGSTDSRGSIAWDDLRRWSGAHGTSWPLVGEAWGDRPAQRQRAPKVLWLTAVWPPLRPVCHRPVACRLTPGCRVAVSSGFAGLLFAMHACSSVSLYGFDLAGSTPGHYFDDATEGIVARLQELLVREPRRKGSLSVDPGIEGVSLVSAERPDVVQREKARHAARAEAYRAWIAQQYTNSVRPARFDIRAAHLERADAPLCSLVPREYPCFCAQLTSLRTPESLPCHADAEPPLRARAGRDSHVRGAGVHPPWHRRHAQGCEKASHLSA